MKLKDLFHVKVAPVRTENPIYYLIIGADKKRKWESKLDDGSRDTDSMQPISRGDFWALVKETVAWVEHKHLIHSQNPLNPELWSKGKELRRVFADWIRGGREILDRDLTKPKRVSRPLNMRDYIPKKFFNVLHRRFEKSPSSLKVVPFGDVEVNYTPDHPIVQFLQRVHVISPPYNNNISYDPKEIHKERMGLLRNMAQAALILSKVTSIQIRHREWKPSVTVVRMRPIAPQGVRERNVTRYPQSKHGNSPIKQHYERYTGPFQDKKYVGPSNIVPGQGGPSRVQMFEYAVGLEFRAAPKSKFKNNKRENEFNRRSSWSPLEAQVLDSEMSARITVMMETLRQSQEDASRQASRQECADFVENIRKNLKKLRKKSTSKPPSTVVVDDTTDEVDDTTDEDGGDGDEPLLPDEFEMIFENAKVRVVIPKTQRAFSKMSVGTGWSSGTNAFKYHRSADVRIVSFKDKKYPDDRWLVVHRQLPTLSYEIYKSGDVSPSRKEILETRKKYRVLHNVFADNVLINPMASRKAQLEAIAMDPYLLSYMSAPLEETQLLAVSKDAWVINLLDNPSEKIQLAAVENDWRVLEIIAKPTEKTQLGAITQNWNALDYIKKPSRKVLIEVVKTDWSAIQDIKPESQFEELQLMAIKQDSRAIGHVINPSDKVQWVIIKHSVDNLSLIKNPSHKVQMYAVKRDGTLIQDIKNPDEDVQFAALRQNMAALKYIDKPTKKVQRWVLETEPRATQWIVSKPIKEIREMRDRAKRERHRIRVRRKRDAEANEKRWKGDVKRYREDPEVKMRERKRQNAKAIRKAKARERKMRRKTVLDRLTNLGM